MGIKTGAGASIATAAGDTAGDGHQDVISVNTFTPAVNAQTPSTADFDEDCRPDLAVPSSCPGSSGWNKVCRAVLANVS